MRANRVRERDAARKREIAGCSFTPRMATRARSASPAPRGRDVATRAATFERERQRRLRELRAKRDALERKDCSFRPRFHTQPHDDESVNTSDTRTVARTTSRLAGTDTAARKTAFREAKLREQLAQHTFSPQIPSSRKVKTPKRATRARRRPTSACTPRVEIGKRNDGTCGKPSGRKSSRRARSPVDASTVFRVRRECLGPFAGRWKG